MEYVQFGSAGVRVSRLGLGMGFRGQGDEVEAQRVVERAMDLGVNLLDCANVYGPMDDRANVGRSEVILGRAIRGKRDQVVITSKATSAMGPGPNDRGSSRYHIMAQVENSLRRLQTDHIDVYLLHQPDPTTRLEESMRALDDLTRSGKIRYAGVCNYPAWQICKALWTQDRINAAPLIAAQNPYHLLNRSAERELFGLVRDQGLGFMAYSPLGVGLLSGAYVPGQPAPAGSLYATRRADQYDALMAGPAGAVIEAVIAVAQELGATPAQVAIAWTLAHPEVTVAITGGDTLPHLENNLAAADLTLPEAHLARLNQVSAGMGMVLD